MYHKEKPLGGVCNMLLIHAPPCFMVICPCRYPLGCLEMDTLFLFKENKGTVPYERQNERLIEGARYFAVANT